MNLFKRFIFKKQLLALSLLLSGAVAPLIGIHKRESLDFSDKTDLHIAQLHFPKDFLWGFAIAEQQNSGADNLPDSNWTRWEQTSWSNGSPHIDEGQTSGKACDHWNLYQKDIDLMKKDFNANSFRFSLAWDRIEPQEGEFNEEALQHYNDEVDALLKAGIKPMITLHHFAHPNWFEDRGGFEKKENVDYFVRYAQKVFERLGDRVELWCTINEPTIYVFQGYMPLNCVFPPGKAASKLDYFFAWPLATRVLSNMMKAHTDAYNTLKKMRHGDKAQIGLVHQYLKFAPYNSFNPLDRIPGYIHNNFMIDAVINFLKTGTFDCCFTDEDSYTAPDGPRGDFVGLNYYSLPRISVLWGNAFPHPGEVMTDMQYQIYPKGIYDALHHMAQIGLPIYITENGIADKEHTNDLRRVQWVEQYLKSISLALEDGIDVRGYYYWTLVDNFEWNMGWHSMFGMYALNRETQERTLKDGGKTYASIIKKARSGDLENPTEDRIEA